MWVIQKLIEIDMVTEIGRIDVVIDTDIVPFFTLLGFTVEIHSA